MVELGRNMAVMHGEKYGMIQGPNGSEFVPAKREDLRLVVVRMIERHLWGHVAETTGLPSEPAFLLASLVVVAHLPHSRQPKVEEHQPTRLGDAYILRFEVSVQYAVPVKRMVVAIGERGGELFGVVDGSFERPAPHRRYPLPEGHRVHGLWQLVRKCRRETLKAKKRQPAWVEAGGERPDDVWVIQAAHELDLQVEIRDRPRKLLHRLAKHLEGDRLPIELGGVNCAEFTLTEE